MIYNDSEEYKIKFYVNPRNDSNPVREYILDQSPKDLAKILKYIEFLRQRNGVLDEPYSKHIRGKLRELRVDFSNNRHRIFYFTFVGKNIILLHVFRKDTAKTPELEIIKAENNLNQIINNEASYVD